MNKKVYKNKVILFLSIVVALVMNIFLFAFVNLKALNASAVSVVENKSSKNELNDGTKSANSTNSFEETYSEPQMPQEASGNDSNSWVDSSKLSVDFENQRLLFYTDKNFDLEYYRKFIRITYSYSVIPANVGSIVSSPTPDKYVDQISFGIDDNEGIFNEVRVATSDEFGNTDLSVYGPDAVIYEFTDFQIRGIKDGASFISVYMDIYDPENSSVASPLAKITSNPNWIDFTVFPYNQIPIKTVVALPDRFYQDNITEYPFVYSRDSIFGYELYKNVNMTANPHFASSPAYMDLFNQPKISYNPSMSTNFRIDRVNTRLEDFRNTDNGSGTNTFIKYKLEIVTNIAFRPGITSGVYIDDRLNLYREGGTGNPLFAGASLSFKQPPQSENQQFIWNNGSQDPLSFDSLPYDSTYFRTDIGKYILPSITNQISILKTKGNSREASTGEGKIYFRINNYKDIDEVIKSSSINASINVFATNQGVDQGNYQNSTSLNQQAERLPNGVYKDIGISNDDEPIFMVDSLPSGFYKFKLEPTSNFFEFSDTYDTSADKFEVGSLKDVPEVYFDNNLKPSLYGIYPDIPYSEWLTYSNERKEYTSVFSSFASSFAQMREINFTNYGDGEDEKIKKLLLDRSYRNEAAEMFDVYGYSVNGQNVNFQFVNPSDIYLNPLFNPIAGIAAPTLEDLFAIESANGERQFKDSENNKTSTNTGEDYKQLLWDVFNYNNLPSKGFTFFNFFDSETGEIRPQILTWGYSPGDEISYKTTPKMIGPDKEEYSSFWRDGTDQPKILSPSSSYNTYTGKTLNEPTFLPTLAPIDKPVTDLSTTSAHITLFPSSYIGLSNPYYDYQLKINDNEVKIEDYITVKRDIPESYFSISQSQWASGNIQLKIDNLKADDRVSLSVVSKKTYIGKFSIADWFPAGFDTELPFTFTVPSAIHYNSVAIPKIEFDYDNYIPPTSLTSNDSVLPIKIIEPTDPNKIYFDGVVYGWDGYDIDFSEEKPIDNVSIANNSSIIGLLPGQRFSLGIKTIAGLDPNSPYRFWEYGVDGTIYRHYVMGEAPRVLNLFGDIYLPSKGANDFNPKKILEGDYSETWFYPIAPSSFGANDGKIVIDFSNYDSGTLGPNLNQDIYKLFSEGKITISLNKQTSQGNIPSSDYIVQNDKIIISNLSSLDKGSIKFTIKDDNYNWSLLDLVRGRTLTKDWEVSFEYPPVVRGVSQIGVPNVDIQSAQTFGEPGKFILNKDSSFTSQEIQNIGSLTDQINKDLYGNIFLNIKTPSSTTNPQDFGTNGPILNFDNFNVEIIQGEFIDKIGRTGTDTLIWEYDFLDPTIWMITPIDENPFRFTEEERTSKLEIPGTVIVPELNNITVEQPLRNGEDGKVTIATTDNYPVTGLTLQYKTTNSSVWQDWDGTSDVVLTGKSGFTVEFQWVLQSIPGLAGINSSQLDSSGNILPKYVPKKVVILDPDTVFPVWQINTVPSDLKVSEPIKTSDPNSHVYESKIKGDFGRVLTLDDIKNIYSAVDNSGIGQILPLTISDVSIGSTNNIILEAIDIYDNKSTLSITFEIDYSTINQSEIVVTNKNYIAPTKVGEDDGKIIIELENQNINYDPENLKATVINSNNSNLSINWDKNTNKIEITGVSSEEEVTLQIEIADKNRYAWESAATDWTQTFNFPRVIDGPNISNVPNITIVAPSFVGGDGRIIISPFTNPFGSVLEIKDSITNAWIPLDQNGKEFTGKPGFTVEYRWSKIDANDIYSLTTDPSTNSIAKIDPSVIENPQEIIVPTINVITNPIPIPLGDGKITVPSFTVDDNLSLLYSIDGGQTWIKIEPTTGKEWVEKDGFNVRFKWEIANGFAFASSQVDANNNLLPQYTPQEITLKDPIDNEAPVWKVSSNLPTNISIPNGVVTNGNNYEATIFTPFGNTFTVAELQTWFVATDNFKVEKIDIINFSQTDITVTDDNTVVTLRATDLVNNSSDLVIRIKVEYDKINQSEIVVKNTDYIAPSKANASDGKIIIGLENQNITYNPNNLSALINSINSNLSVNWDKITNTIEITGVSSEEEVTLQIEIADKQKYAWESAATDWTQTFNFPRVIDGPNISNVPNITIVAPSFVGGDGRIIISPFTNPLGSVLEVKDNITNTWIPLDQNGKEFTGKAGFTVEYRWSKIDANDIYSLTTDPSTNSIAKIDPSVIENPQEIIVPIIDVKVTEIPIPFGEGKITVPSFTVDDNLSLLYSIDSGQTWIKIEPTTGKEWVEKDGFNVRFKWEIANGFAFASSQVDANNNLLPQYTPQEITLKDPIDNEAPVWKVSSNLPTNISIPNGVVANGNNYEATIFTPFGNTFTVAELQTWFVATDNFKVEKIDIINFSQTDITVTDDNTLVTLRATDLVNNSSDLKININIKYNDVDITAITIDKFEFVDSFTGSGSITFDQNGQPNVTFNINPTIIDDFQNLEIEYNVFDKDGNPVNYLNNNGTLISGWVSSNTNISNQWSSILENEWKIAVRFKPANGFRIIDGNASDLALDQNGQPTKYANSSNPIYYEITELYNKLEEQTIEPTISVSGQDGFGKIDSINLDIDHDANANVGKATLLMQFIRPYTPSNLPLGTSVVDSSDNLPVFGYEIYIPNNSGGMDNDDNWILIEGIASNFTEWTLPSSDIRNQWNSQSSINPNDVLGVEKSFIDPNDSSISLSNFYSFRTITRANNVGANKYAYQWEDLSTTDIDIDEPKLLPSKFINDINSDFSSNPYFGEIISGLLTQPGFDFDIDDFQMIILPLPGNQYPYENAAKITFNYEPSIQNGDFYHWIYRIKDENGNVLMDWSNSLPTNQYIKNGNVVEVKYEANTGYNIPQSFIDKLKTFTIDGLKILIDVSSVPRPELEFSGFFGSAIISNIIESDQTKTPYIKVPGELPKPSTGNINDPEIQWQYRVFDKDPNTMDLEQIDAVQWTNEVPKNLTYNNWVQVRVAPVDEDKYGVEQKVYSIETNNAGINDSYVRVSGLSIDVDSLSGVTVEPNEKSNVLSNKLEVIPNSNDPKVLTNIEIVEFEGRFTTGPDTDWHQLSFFDNKLSNGLSLEFRALSIDSSLAKFPSTSPFVFTDQVSGQEYLQFDSWKQVEILNIKYQIILGGATINVPNLIPMDNYPKDEFINMPSGMLPNGYTTVDTTSVTGTDDLNSFFANSYYIDENGNKVSASDKLVIEYAYDQFNSFTGNLSSGSFSQNPPINLKNGDRIRIRIYVNDESEFTIFRSKNLTLEISGLYESPSSKEFVAPQLTFFGENGSGIAIHAKGYEEKTNLNYAYQILDADKNVIKDWSSEKPNNLSNGMLVRTRVTRAGVDPINPDPNADIDESNYMRVNGLTDSNISTGSIDAFLNDSDNLKIILEELNNLRVDGINNYSAGITNSSERLANLLSNNNIKLVYQVKGNDESGSDNREGLNNSGEVLHLSNGEEVSFAFQSTSGSGERYSLSEIIDDSSKNIVLKVEGLLNDEIHTKSLSKAIWIPLLIAGILALGIIPLYTLLAKNQKKKAI